MKITIARKLVVCMLILYLLYNFVIDNTYCPYYLCPFPFGNIVNINTAISMNGNMHIKDDSIRMVKYLDNFEVRLVGSQQEYGPIVFNLDEGRVVIMHNVNARPDVVYSPFESDDILYIYKWNHGQSYCYSDAPVRDVVQDVVDSDDNFVFSSNDRYKYQISYSKELYKRLERREVGVSSRLSVFVGSSIYKIPIQKLINIPAVAAAAAVKGGRLVDIGSNPKRILEKSGIDVYWPLVKGECYSEGVSAHQLEFCKNDVFCLTKNPSSVVRYHYIGEVEASDSWGRSMDVLLSKSSLIGTKIRVNEHEYKISDLLKFPLVVPEDGYVYFYYIHHYIITEINRNKRNCDE